MMHVLSWWMTLLLAVFLRCRCSQDMEAAVVSVPLLVHNISANEMRERSFFLMRSQLRDWEQHLHIFCLENNLLEHRNRIASEVARQIRQTRIPLHELFEPANSELASMPTAISTTTTTTVVRAILALSATLFDKTTDRDSSPLFYASQALFLAQKSAVYSSLMARLLAAEDMDSILAAIHPRPPSRLPNFLRKLMAPITLYQSRGAFTGGTTAMRVLANCLADLGFPTILCNDTNALSTECRHPSPNGVVVTGEWCHEVADSYTAQPYLGRGVQYFLGFHHGRDFCKGWISVADSHFLQTTLSRNSISAYYLGCPMAEYIERALLPLLASALHVSADEGIRKENLLVVDPDYFTFYLPQQPLSVQVDGLEAVLAQDLSPEAVVRLLQRAKVTLDLALPGPERLSSEAILFGATPVLSDRWNGASTVDFPAFFRVNAQSAHDVSQALREAARSHGRESRAARLVHAEHYLSVLSMWTKLAHTADVFFSSSALHFVLVASNPAEESLAVFQVVALLHFFPLASLTLYVRDSRWFQRHHYMLWDMLRQAGYVREDPFDPHETAAYFDAHRPSSLFQVRGWGELPLEERGGGGENADAGERPASLPWPAVTCWMAVGLAFADPLVLLERWMAHVTDEDTVVCWTRHGQVDACASPAHPPVAVLSGPSASWQALLSLHPLQATPSVGVGAGLVHVWELDAASLCAGPAAPPLCEVTQQPLWTTLERFACETHGGRPPPLLGRMCAPRGEGKGGERAG